MRYKIEFKVAAVRMVLAYEQQHGTSRSKAILKVAVGIDISPEALRSWMVDAGQIEAAEAAPEIKLKSSA